MPLFSIKKSTKKLKRTILRRAHRFSSAEQSPSPKDHNQEQKSSIPSTPQTNFLSSEQSIASHLLSLLHQPGLFDISVFESTSFLFDEKYNRHEQTPQALFNIIIDSSSKKISIYRSKSDVIALKQLLNKHYDDIPYLPVFIDTTNSSITAPTFITGSLVRNLTLWRLFIKTKTIKSNGESLQSWLRSCATHPILGRSAQLRAFLSPQREHDTVTTKSTHPVVPQHHQRFGPPTGNSIDETPITLPIALSSQQQQPSTHPKSQYSHISIYSLATTNEYAIPDVADAASHYHELGNSILKLSSIVSLCVDSTGNRSNATIELDDEELDDNDSYGEGDDDKDTDNNTKNSIIYIDHDDRELSLISLPPLKASSGLIDDLEATSNPTVSSMNQHTHGHPLLLSSSKLASPPSHRKTSKTVSSQKSSSTQYRYQHKIDTAGVDQGCRQMTFDDLQCLKVLGKGSMGKVILVRHQQSARLYALKTISKEWVITRREIDHTLMERDILAKVSKTKHPFLIKLHNAFQNANQLFLVMDYHVGSDLATQLQVHYCFDSDRCRFYIAEILLGLQELHRLGVLYRDLKPENILLAADGHIVLTDFGFSRLFDQDEENQLNGNLDSTGRLRQPFHTGTFCGTIEYMAVEMYSSDDYTFAVDYWSLGIILYEMLLGYTPFDADNDAEIYRRVMEDPIDIPDDMLLDTADLIRGLLERDPRRRLGCARFFNADNRRDSNNSSPQSITLDQDDLQHHPYFYSLDWSDVYNKRLPAPYIPHINSETDVSHFDPHFVKLPPRLSVPGHHDDFDSNGDDSFGINPGTKTRVNAGSTHWEEAFVGYSYIHNNTALETDSSLIDDIYHHQQHGNIRESTSPMIMNPSTALPENLTMELKQSDIERHYYGTVCTAVTTPTTVTSIIQVKAALTHQHTINTSPVQPLSSCSSPMPCSTNPRTASSGQQLGFTRLQYWQTQHRSSRSFPSLILESVYA